MLNSILLACIRGLVAFWVLVGATAASASLTFELRTGNRTTNTQKLTADSNNCAATGPRAAYVGGIVTNSSASRIDNTVVAMGGLNGNVYFAGGQPASLYIGALGPGESRAVFWFVGYGCTFGAGANPTITMTSGNGSQIATLNLVIASSISANAGGDLIGSSLGSGAVVGQTVYFDAKYDFGGTDPGDEFFLQPAGAQAFDASCFRLVGSEVIGSNVNAAPVGLRNELYRVQPTKQSGNNYFITVRYFFQYRCADKSTTAKPYAVQTSGQRLKYTGNSDAGGGIEISFPGASNPFTISKSVSEAEAFVGASGDLTYTITISNPSVHDAVLDRIRDTLPAGMTFKAIASGSEVASSNSSAIPPPGSTGTIDFIGRQGISYQVPAGGSVRLVYIATRPTAAGSFTNSAQGIFGQATTPIARATYSQTDFSPITTTKVSAVFSDPKNGTANPFAIPGAVIEYSIGVSNPNAVALDQDTVLVTDFGPAEAVLCQLDTVGTGPISFVDGSPSSTLALDFQTLVSETDGLEFSDDYGLSWDYTPIPDANGCDPNVSGFRVALRGAFAGSSNFTLKARYKIK